MKDMHMLLTENFSKKPPVHPAINTEIERIKAILFERNFTLPIVEQGTDVEDNSYTEGVKCIDKQHITSFQWFRFCGALGKSG